MKCSISFEFLPSIDQRIYTVMIIMIGSNKSKCQDPRAGTVVLWCGHIYWWYFEHSLFRQNILLYPSAWGRQTGLYIISQEFDVSLKVQQFFLKSQYHEASSIRWKVKKNISFKNDFKSFLFDRNRKRSILIICAFPYPTKLLVLSYGVKIT